MDCAAISILDIAQTTTKKKYHKIKTNRNWKTSIDVLDIDTISIRNNEIYVGMMCSMGWWALLWTSTRDAVNVRERGWRSIENCNYDIEEKSRSKEAKIERKRKRYRSILIRQKRSMYFHSNIISNELHSNAMYNQLNVLIFWVCVWVFCFCI